MGTPRCFSFDDFLKQFLRVLQNDIKVNYRL